MLQSVIRSVTRNILSILLTTTLAVIVMYLYSIIGYIFFSTDFMVETRPTTIIKHGMRQLEQDVIIELVLADICDEKVTIC